MKHISLFAVPDLNTFDQDELEPRLYCPTSLSNLMDGSKSLQQCLNNE